MKSKRTKATEFSSKARKTIIERDKGECFFCLLRYHMDGATEFDKKIKDLMHYIPRSSGGLGIPENAAVGCRFHHTMYDNGHQGNHYEMREIFKGYLKSRHPGWDEKKLVFNKWDFLEGSKEK